MRTSASVQFVHFERFSVSAKKNYCLRENYILIVIFFFFCGTELIWISNISTVLRILPIKPDHCHTFIDTEKIMNSMLILVYFQFWFIFQNPICNSFALQIVIINIVQLKVTYFQQRMLSAALFPCWFPIFDTLHIILDLSLSLFLFVFVCRVVEFVVSENSKRFRIEIMFTIGFSAATIPFRRKISFRMKSKPWK